MCDNSGSACYGDVKLIPVVLGMLVSKIAFEFLKVLNPTLHFQAGNLSSLPLPNILTLPLEECNKKAISVSKADWDSFETSWDFTRLPLLQPDYCQPTLKATYQQLRAHWQKITLEMQRLEEENNRIFIEVYGLQDELTPDVPLEEITLTCNPYYRYGKKPQIHTDKHRSENQENICVNPCPSVVQKTFPKDKELEERLVADTMKEFISYSVGCMFGRYALEKPGLILANQGETIDDYYKKLNEIQINTDEHGLENNKNNIRVNPCLSVVQNLFPPDTDNVIPILDGDWFPDDITERFFKFLRVTFGDEHFEENLKFIEQAIGKTIRKYFLKDFYNDHVKRYKKRPIYWLFSSPKSSFNVLIYMHRYRPDTVSVVLNDYLREFRAKLSSEKNRLEAVSISASATAGEKTKALKAIEKVNKIITELEEYEREVLYPLATEQVEIDLDDGVKVNYPKFGKALKKIPGLSAKDN